MLINKPGKVTLNLKSKTCNFSLKNISFPGIFILLLLSAASFAQPINNDCSGALALSVNPFGQSCSNAVTVNTLNATASITPANACGNADNNDDVWYKFDATSAQHIFRFSGMTQLLGSPNSIGMTLYNGGPSASAACPASATSFFCSAAWGFNSGYQLIGGFTAGNTYYIRLWTTGTQNAASFAFCVQEVPPPPANDDCSGALSLTVQAFGQTCTNATNVTTAGATQSSTPANACGGADNNDDVWYKFDATSAQHVFRFSGMVQLLGSPNSIGMTLYDGGPSASATCPSPGTSITCDVAYGFNNGYRLLGGFTPGHTYYIRLWAAGTQNMASFSFCVQEVPPPPANDDCSGALSLTVQPYGQTCTNATNVTTAGATQSSTPVNACGNADNNDDVWYKFDATSSQHIFRFSGMTQLLGSPNSLGMTLYDGGPSGAAACPVSTTSFFCSAAWGFNNGYQLIGGFTAGNTYYIRLWAAGTQNAASFAFCVQEVPPPPANDDCSGALSLAVQPFGQTCTNATTVTTAGATQSSTPVNACGNADNNDDVWYKFDATSAQHVFRFSGMMQLLGSPNSIGMTLYDGGPSASTACPASTASLFCSAAWGFNSGYQLVGGFTPGNTYYIRLWAAGTQNMASFSFCVQEVPPPPANDDCSSALSLTVQPFGQTCTNATNVTTAGATQSAEPVNACGSADNNDDVWYKFDATSAQHVFRFSGMIQLLGSPNSIGMTLYDGGPSASTACPASTASLFCSAAWGFNSGYQLIGGFTAGNTYYIRLWAAGAQNFASFEFCVQEVPPPPVNDNCIGAVALNVQPFGQTCTASVTVNTAGATASTNPANSCGNTENNDDVWYKFNATSAQHIFRYTGMVPLLGSSHHLGMTIYDGGPSESATCPGTSANIMCDQAFGFTSGYRLVSGFTPGRTYFIRLWGAGAQNFASFDFCVQEVPPPPVNDDCPAATLVTLQTSELTCNAFIEVNTAGATQSGNKPNCNPANDTEDDIWYKFIATSATIRLFYENLQQLLGTPNHIGYAFYKDACPSGSSNLVCTNAFGFFGGRTLIGGFEPGSTYYLRLWSSGSENFASFKLCLQAVIPPPNDECTNAIPLQTGAGFCTQAAVTNMFDATTSAGFSNAPSCRAGARTEDVWYTATIPSTGNLIVETSPANANINDLVMVAYTGNCGALTQLACDDNGNPETSPAADHPRLVFTGRTPGEKITFRVVAANENNMGRFSICAVDTSSSILPNISATGNCTKADTLYISDSLANGYRWLPIFDDAGHIVAEVYPNSSQKDTIYTSLFINISGTPGIISGKYYANRHIAVTNRSMDIPGRIRMYIKNDEINALQAVDSTVAGISNLKIISDTSACNTVITKEIYSPETTWSRYGNSYYLQVSIIRLGQFFAQGKCTSSIVWNGNKNTNWHDPENWACGGVPWLHSDVIIPAGRPNQPVIQVPVEIKSIHIQPTASITVQPGVPLKINGQ